MEKDYSLLRPFDLESAKRGDPVQYNSISDQITYLAGPDPKGNIAYQSKKMIYIAHVNSFKMAPLAWVEGKPVYRWDVLYGTGNCSDYRYDVVGFDEKSGHIISHSNETCSNRELPEFLTWQKPKTKREWWVNIVPFTKSGAVGEIKDKIVRNCDIFDDYDTAKKWADKCKDVIATVPISWEE